MNPAINPANDPAASHERPTAGSEHADPQHTASQSADSSTDGSTASLRMRRIQDLQAQALAKADPLEANLGAANGALLRLAFRMEQAIEGSLADFADPVTRIERLTPAIETYLKLMRQADRFAQLDQRLACHAGKGAKSS